MVNSPRLEQAGQQIERSKLHCRRVGNIFAQAPGDRLIWRRQKGNIGLIL